MEPVKCRLRCHGWWQNKVLLIGTKVYVHVCVQNLLTCNNCENESQNCSSVVQNWFMIDKCSKNILEYGKIVSVDSSDVTFKTTPSTRLPIIRETFPGKSRGHQPKGFTPELSWQPTQSDASILSNTQMCWCLLSACLVSNGSIWYTNGSILSTNWC